jgi:hypothetical protein
MVLEKLYDLSYIKSHRWILLLISFSYTIISIGTSVLLFDENHAVIALTFLSLALLATLSRILRLDEPHEQSKEQKDVIKDYMTHVLNFILIFIGIILPFAIFSMILPERAVFYLFSSQASLLPTTIASDMYQSGTVASIFLNNIVVLGICFVASFIMGTGAIFFFIIVWNASIIGVVFGSVAKHTGIINGISPLYVFAALILGAFAHLVLEIMAYLMAGLSGQDISDWIMLDRKSIVKLSNVRFRIMCTNVALLVASVILIYVGALFEKSLAPYIIKLLIP